MRIHKCERCGQDVPRSEATQRGDGRRVKSWHPACYLAAVDIKPGPYQVGSTGETDESGRMVWRWSDSFSVVPA